MVVVGRLLSIDFSLSFFGDFQKYRADSAHFARYFLAQLLAFAGRPRGTLLANESGNAQGEMGR